MSIKCRINYNSDGSISSVSNPQGETSALFNTLAMSLGESKALDVYALTDTDEFRAVKARNGTKGEGTVKEALTFATRKDTTLTKQNERDLRETLVGIGGTRYSDITRAFEKGIVVDGVIIFTEKSLRATGMYNNFEIKSILGSVSRQESIRGVYQALKNSEDKGIELVDPLYVVTTSELNTLGKQVTMNPYLVEQEVSEIVAGKDLDLTLDEVPYDIIKSRYTKFKEQLDTLARNTRNLFEKKIENGALVDKTQNNLKAKLEKVLRLDDVSDLVNTVSFISATTPLVWQQSEDNLYTILKDFNDQAKETGVDFLDLQDRVLTSSQEDILDLLNSYSDLLTNPSDETMEYFVSLYSDFFSISEDVLSRPVSTQDDTLIYLDTTLPESEIFNTYSLLKADKNVYKQVEKIENLEEAYEILLANKPEYETLEKLRDFVAKTINEEVRENSQVPLSEIENMIVHKMYFNLRLDTPKESDPHAKSKYTQLVENYTYLTEEYPSDFYVEYLKEKQKNSEAFKNLYSKFDVNEKGIVLLSNDPLTLATIEPYITFELAQYNLVSRNLNIPIKQTEDVEVSEMQFNRENAINNPDSVPKVKGDFSIISSTTIAVRNEVENFVQTPNGVYEFDYQIGDVAFYNILPKPNPYYNSYGQHKIKTESNVDVRGLGSMELRPESFIKAKNYYNMKELEQINQQFFEC